MHRGVVSVLAMFVLLSMLAELNEKSKERIQAMEEGGEISYWSVIFKAESFTDLIDRLNMVRESGTDKGTEPPAMRAGAASVFGES